MTPDKQGKAVRDACGRFLPGTSGNPNGRPRGRDWRALVAGFRGDSLDSDLLAVYAALIVKARSGDVQAARLLLDRLCDPIPQEPADDVSDHDRASWRAMNASIPGRAVWPPDGFGEDDL